MAGMRVNAERALMIGLVQDIFPEDTFLDDVYAFCRKMMEIDAEVLGLAKLSIDMFTDVQDRTVQRHIDRIVVTTTFDKFARTMQGFKERAERREDG